MKSILTLASLALVPGLALSFNSPAPGAVPRAAAAAGETYRIDGGHSSVVFSCEHFGISRFYGRFNEVSGEVLYDESDPSASSVLAVIQAASVDSNSEGRDRHLKSNDFLNAAEYPEITFESRSVRAEDGGLVVIGDLAFHGVTKEVRAEVSLIGSGDTMFGDFRRGFEATFEIDMRDFGVAFVEKNPSAVGPSVRITISLECVREA